MGLVQCIRNMFREEEDYNPRNRLSNLNQDFIILTKLDLLYDHLMRKRDNCKKHADEYLKHAYENKKDIGKAKIYLLKKKICENSMKNIDSKILLVQKQKANVQNLQEDKEFYKTINQSNELIRELNNEINTDVLTEAIDLLNESEDTQHDINNIMIKLGIEQNEAELNQEFNNLDQIEEKHKKTVENLLEDDKNKQELILN